MISFLNNISSFLTTTYILYHLLPQWVNWFFLLDSFLLWLRCKQRFVLGSFAANSMFWCLLYMIYCTMSQAWLWAKRNSSTVGFVLRRGDLPPLYHGGPLEVRFFFTVFSFASIAFMFHSMFTLLLQIQCNGP